MSSEAARVPERPPTASVTDKTSGRTWFFLACVACLGPFLFIASRITSLWVNVPFSDEWEFVRLVQQFKSGSLSVGDFWAQHGEQRIFFPRLLMMGLAVLSHWDVRWEFVANVVLAVGIFVLLAVLVWRSFAPSLGGWTFVFLAVLSIIIFSPLQWEDWLWGWQISWFLSILGAIGALTLLSVWPEGRSPAFGTVLAGMAAALGHLSLTSGGLVWVAAVPVFLTRKHLGKWLWLWVGMGASAWTLYLYHYHSMPKLGNPHLYRLGRYAAYVLYYLARPFLREGHIIWVGSAVVGLFAISAVFFIILRREGLHDAAPWLGIGLYSGISAAATSLNRVGLGLWQAGSSRYTTMSSLFAVSTAALLALAIPRALPLLGNRFSGSRAAPAVAVWVGLGIAFLARYPVELRFMNSWAVERLQIKQCLVRAAEVTDPCLAKAYPIPEVVFERTQILKKFSWGGF